VKSTRSTEFVNGDRKNEPAAITIGVNPPPAEHAGLAGIDLVGVGQHRPVGLEEDVYFPPWPVPYSLSEIAPSV
jgi:hypothetical protein